MYVRGKEHLKAIRQPTQYKNNAFGKHSIEHHNSKKNVKYRLDIVRSYRKPLERQVREGVEIFRMKPDIIMNSKLDYYKPGVRRMAFQQLFDE